MNPHLLKYVLLNIGPLHSHQDLKIDLTYPYLPQNVHSIVGRFSLYLMSSPSFGKGGINFWLSFVKLWTFLSRAIITILSIIIITGCIEVGESRCIPSFMLFVVMLTRLQLCLFLNHYFLYILCIPQVVRKIPISPLPWGCMRPPLLDWKLWGLVAAGIIVCTKKLLYKARKNNKNLFIYIYYVMMVRATRAQH